MRRALIFGLVALTMFSGSAHVCAQNAPHEAGYRYLSPVPNASYVSALTRYFLVRFEDVDPSQVANLTNGFITVVGDVSGVHSGLAHIASDGRTVIFDTGVPTFVADELVTVTLNPMLNPAAPGSVTAYQYQFSVSSPMPGSLPLVLAIQPVGQPIGPSNSFSQALITSATNVKVPSGKRAALKANGVSVPSDFPASVITVNSNPSPGYLFLENALSGPAYTMLLGNDGMPVWYRRGRMYDFKVQRNGTLSWGGYDTTGGYIFMMADQNFNIINSFGTTNGYVTDPHELKILPDGSYFLIGDLSTVVDLSQYIVGGSTFAYVMESVVQGFTPTGELIFQWRPWDNYDIRDLPGGYTTDFPHMNAIDVDADGNLVVSARHLSEVTKINRDTGEIIWRLGGVHSSFNFVNDPLNGTSFQHAVSALGNGHYMVFDNGDYHTPQVSRAVEYQIDLTNKTATMAWQFRDSPDKYAWYTGNAQRLPSGNTLIDFALAAYPKAIEVDTNDVKRFELSLVPSTDSYRAFRFPWSGAVSAPYLIAEPELDNVTLVFNKFGDTNVGYYRIYGGLSPHPTQLLAESGTTLKRLYNLQNGLNYFRVTAVNLQGVESPFSNEESLPVNIISPGQNMVANGDFSQGTNGWTFNVSNGALAAWTLQNGSAYISITNGGSSLSAIQLLQPGKALIQGTQYVLDFDAWSTQGRYINVQLSGGVSPFPVYTTFSSSFLTPNTNHYRYVFTMQASSDSAGRLLFNLGSANGDVFLDNIKLFSPPAGDLNLDGRVDVGDLSAFVGNWLKSTNAPADLDGNGKVDFLDFNILGNNWGLGSAP